MLNAIEKLARGFALLGGATLSFLILLTCASIVGRSLNSIFHSDWSQTTIPEFANYLLSLGVGPINGDYELVEAGMVFAIFAFIPLCQWHNAHAKVTIFTSKLPPKAQRLLIAIIECVFALVLIVIAKQLFEGMESKRNSGQVTFLLEYPLWWSYALGLSAAIASAIVASVLAGARLMELSTGRKLLPESKDAEH
ncbi:MAG: TRAP-type C4-dicarboxylate transport system permease small subunit [bacterium]|jgi:TRAP-type C4-dicarboxylate transport system permease small subunit